MLQRGLRLPRCVLQQKLKDEAELLKLRMKHEDEASPREVFWAIART